MKIAKCCFLLILLSFRTEAQEMLIDKNSRVSFFSSAPLEDISAVTQQAASALDTQRLEIAFKVPIAAFLFRKELMRTHFNENYLESDRYPHAAFSGKISPPPAWQVDGSYRIAVTGNLDIHGVKKTYSVPATVVVKGETISASSTFRVKLADHKIRIPRVVTRNIAEVVEVTVSATYQKQ